MAEHWSWPVDVANLLVDSSSLFVCGDQSGRTSAPIRPHALQTVRRQTPASHPAASPHSATE